MANLLIHLPTKFKVQLMKYYKLIFSLSMGFVFLLLAFIGFSGIKLGIDFTGGTQLIYRNDQVPDMNSIRKILNESENEILKHSSIQSIDRNDILIKSKPLSTEDVKKLELALKEQFPKLQKLSEDTIGPSIGKELKEQSIWIVILAVLGLLIYIALRFDWMMGLSAILALLHDAAVAMTFMVLFSYELDTSLIAALLTILGYSINDTIVMFDRFREIHAQSPEENLILLADLSITQTIARSINTVLTVLLVLVAMYLWGGVTLKNFVAVLFVGFVSGMYSSIIIAMPAYLFFKSRKKSL